MISWSLYFGNFCVSIYLNASKFILSVRICYKVVLPGTWQLLLFDKIEECVIIIYAILKKWRFIFKFLCLKILRYPTGWAWVKLLKLYDWFLQNGVDSITMRIKLLYIMQKNHLYWLGEIFKLFFLIYYTFWRNRITNVSNFSKK